MLLSKAPVVTDFDVALAHGGTHGCATDVWTIAAQEGDNTLERVAGEFCTHYWIHRVEITRALEFSDVSRLPGGAVQLTWVGEPGWTNLIEVSADLANWAGLTNLVSVAGTVQRTDTPSAGINRRFYRAVGL